MDKKLKMLEEIIGYTLKNEHLLPPCPEKNEPLTKKRQRFILNDIEHKQLFYDSKTILQEIVQSGF